MADEEEGSSRCRKKFKMPLKITENSLPSKILNVYHVPDTFVSSGYSSEQNRQKYCLCWTLFIPGERNNMQIKCNLEKGSRECHGVGAGINFYTHHLNPVKAFVKRLWRKCYNFIEIHEERLNTVISFFNGKDLLLSKEMTK